MDFFNGTWRSFRRNFSTVLKRAVLLLPVNHLEEKGTNAMISLRYRQTVYVGWIRTARQVAQDAA